MMDCYKDIICYPRYDEEHYLRRIKEINAINLRLLEYGNSIVNGIKVLGKGHDGIVMKGLIDGKEVAVKFKRLDSSINLLKEAYMLRLAESIAPRVYYASHDMIVMEYIDGIKIKDYLDRLDYNIAKDILSSCFRLDLLAIDHGELSKMDNHVIITNNKVRIIDFGSASINRRVSNLTSASQYLNKRDIFKDKDLLLKALKRYKACICYDCFNDVIRLLKVK